MLLEKQLILKILEKAVRIFIIHYMKKGALSIIVHGSAGREEISLFRDKREDILLGNIGFTIVTNSSPANVISYYKLMKFLRNIDKSELRNMLQKPLILLKPFEIPLIPYYFLFRKYIPPDLWTFEIKETGRVIYGRNVLHLFNEKFGLDAGYRLLINRLFGLNLCLPLILRSDFDSKLNVLAVNYESVKGILGCLEALLVLLGKYRPTYSERASLTSEVVETYAEAFEDAYDTLEAFKLASKLKLNPHGLEKLSPTEYWFKSRSLLDVCLKIYNFQGNLKEDKFHNEHRTHLLHVVKVEDILKIIANGKFDPKILLPKNKIEETATRLMLSCVFSMTPRLCGKPSGVKKLISASRYSNFLHTRGELYEITDHLKHIRPN